MSTENQNFKDRAMDFSRGTPSGGGTQEDPPTGGSGGRKSTVNGEPDQVMCDFSVLHHKIDKNNAPLFKNYPGDVHCFVPFRSFTEDPDNNEEYKILEKKRKEFTGKTNPYLSEVVFFFKAQRGILNIQTVRNNNRNRIFLGQAVWFKPNEMPTRQQPGVKVSNKHWGEDTKPIQYIIHEIRPVYRLKNWTCKEDESHPKLDTTVEPLDFNNRNYWLIVVRPRKADLKHEENKYGIGIVDTPKKSTNGELAIPQLYQNVEVYGYDKSEEDKSKKIKIIGNGMTRATIEVVPKIVLMPHPKNK